MPTQFLPTGSPAPTFKLTTIGSKRLFSLAELRGQWVMLLFADYSTATAARQTVEVVRRRFPDHTEIAIAIIIDLQMIPRLLHGAAERFIEGAYRDASKEIPDGFDPADHLIMLPDWSHKIAAGYGIGNVSQFPAVVLIDPEGKIAAGYQVPDSGIVTVGLLRQKLEEGADPS